MKLKGMISSANRAKDGHSQVRVTVPGFGEVIFSAPKAELVELLGAPDDVEMTIELSWQVTPAAGTITAVAAADHTIRPGPLLDNSK